jgi:4a-hydroxytetrahydrobiopterin dehydratase
MTDSDAATNRDGAENPWESPGLTPKQFHECDGVEDWRVVGEGASAYFPTGSFASGVQLVQAIGELDGIDAAHHPDIDVRYEGVTVRLTTITGTHYYNGHSMRDVELARRISAAARDLGIPTDPSVLRNIQVTVDALAIPAVMPFWKDVLGYLYRVDTEEDLIDPLGRGPSFWFQQMDAPRPQRNRLHVDVGVPHDQIQARTAAAIAAGGQVVDQQRPWVLADPEGNEVCLVAADW